MGDGAVASCLAALLLATGCASSSLGSNGDPSPSLHVSRHRLVVRSGRGISLRGVNWTGPAFDCTHGGGVGEPLARRAVQALLAWHINVVRVGVAEDCWLGINGAPIGMTASAYRQWLAHDLRVLHRHGIYTEVGLTYAAPGSRLSDHQPAMPDRDHSVTFWRSFARWFKSEPDTFFGLFGEPSPPSRNENQWLCWREGGPACPTVRYWGRSYAAAGMQELVDIIRAAGSVLPISVSGVHWATDLSGWLRYEPRDPLHQLLAEWHQYPGDEPCYDFSGHAVRNDVACWNGVIGQLAKHVPVFNGEAGEYAHSDACKWRALPSYLAWAEAHRVGYALWSWGPPIPRTIPCENMALIEDYSGKPTPIYGWGYRHWLSGLHR
jgi:endoglucanase